MISSFDLEKPSRNGRCATASISSCAAAAPRPWRRNSAESRQGITPSQTVGPYFAYGLTPNGKYDWNDAFSNNLVTADTSGGRIRIEGRVFDGNGAPVPDACSRCGRRMDRGDSAIRRTIAACTILVQGIWPLRHRRQKRLWFDTIKPGAVPDPDGKPQAPHLLLAVYTRGMLLHLYTRIYLDGEAGNAADPVMALVPAERRGTLIAARQPGSGNAVYRFDVRLQGDNETVFFDI